MNKLITLLILALVFAVVLLGGTSAYSAWTASRNHHASCARVDLLADEFQSVIVLALTPPKNKPYTAAQAAAAGAFEAEASTLLDRARC